MEEGDAGMKLFCLGLHKTGTTSLKKAMQLEGYSVATFFGIDDPMIGVHGLDTALSRVENYDVFQDDPWYLYYREFYQHVPDAKFVLLLRDDEEWYQSCLSHFAGTENHVRNLVYGEGNSDPVGRKQIWISRKKQHEENVRAFFKEDPDALLELAITAGEGWEKLGPFLGVTPQHPDFPKTNTAQGRKHHETWVQWTEAKGLRKLLLRIRMKLLRLKR